MGEGYYVRYDWLSHVLGNWVRKGGIRIGGDLVIEGLVIHDVALPPQKSSGVVARTFSALYFLLQSHWG